MNIIKIVSIVASMLVTNIIASMVASSQIAPYQTIQLEESAPEITAMAVSSDGNIIAVGAKDVRLYDRSQNSFVATLPNDHSHQIITSLAFSRDDRYLLVGDDESRAALWDVSANKKLLEVTSYPFTEPYDDIPSLEGMLAVAFSDDGASFCTCDGNGALQRWNTKTGGEVQRYGLRFRTKRIDDLGNSVIGFQGKESGYLLVNSETGNVIKAITTKDTALSPNKSFVIFFEEEVDSAGQDQFLVKSFDLKTYQSATRFLWPPSQGLISLQLSQTLLVIDGFEVKDQYQHYNRLFYDLNKSVLVANQPLDLAPVEVGGRTPVFFTLFSPNGKNVIQSSARKVELFDISDLKASADKSQLLSR
ncbi:MAG: hypothetical protein GC154_20140 [bacterium]|nr:hypothetical protein [bacterium]